MKNKDTVLEALKDKTIEHKITQKQVESKLEDFIDNLLEQYNETHSVHLNYHDVVHSIELMAGWKK